jgi:hypothetical protein
LVPIALDGEELVPDGVLLPDELQAATPRARITADIVARPDRTFGLMDLWLIALNSVVPGRQSPACCGDRVGVCISSGAKVGRVRGAMSAAGAFLVMCLELPPSRLA